MNINKEQLQSLDDILSKLNELTSFSEVFEFLSENVEDVDFFLQVLKKAKKVKLPVKKTEKKTEFIETNAYSEEEIYEILSSGSNEEISKEYSLKELKKMYASIYKHNPTLDKTKANILSTLRNRMHTMKRAEAFRVLAEERENRNKK